MKIFLVAAVLCLTILAQSWGTPGQHFLIETEDAGDNHALPLDEDGGDDNDGGGDYCFCPLSDTSCCSSDCSGWHCGR